MGELGTRLVRAREARGLSLGDAERDTRISRRYLEALEAEQFDVIPAPVYARGFLRSYSQYLGEDPQEMLGLFPREDDTDPPQSPPGARPSMQAPVSGSSASRPVWKRPPRPQPPVRQQARANSVQPPPTSVPASPPDEPTINFAGSASDGPTIGIDIGLGAGAGARKPAPARRINPDLGNRSRSILVLTIAVAAVLAVILMAVLISNLGGDSKTPTPATPTLARGAATTTRAPASSPTPPGSAAPNTTPGSSINGPVVPNVKGQTASAARQVLEDAGYVVSELHQRSSQPKNTVIDQSPAVDTPLDLGLKVTIAISDGP